MVKPAILSTGLLASPIHSLYITALNLTAISASNGRSTLECWQIGPLKSVSTIGSPASPFYFLGDFANVTYNVFPPHTNDELHTAPAFQLVFFASGTTRVTLPDRSDEVTIQGGKKGLIIAADTADVSMQGHRTYVSTEENTVVLQLPIKDARKFKHTVLHSGGCHESEMSGL
ncbi:small secreted protein [Ophiocordyceps camponoti-floridani]|uniref:Small secreted protein n=1 Tax=Ophiocordyceps camponoti-floridani TaxID=2030778 RepID=A0A8H4Q8R1_9HYPO|nr:small secreted protein [Ophiocordyceps camponoti-floridani]